MEDLAKPVALNHEMVQTLDQIRAGADSALYGASPAQADELFKKHLASLIVGSGMPVLQVMHYQWFLRELARLWRTRKGRDLAFHLELTIRKWVSLGLEPRTLQFLICEAHQRLKGRNLSTKTSSHQGGDMTGSAKTGTVPRVERSEGLSPAFAPETPSAESADVRSPEPDSTTKTQRHEGPATETAKDAKTGPDSDTGPLDSSTPGVLR
jgi:hypothetical protein